MFIEYLFKKLNKGVYEMGKNKNFKKKEGIKKFMINRENKFLIKKECCFCVDSKELKKIKVELKKEGLNINNLSENDYLEIIKNKKVVMVEVLK